MNETVKMTEEQFKKALDEVVLKGVNDLGAGTVLGALAIVTRFTEVIYDMNVVSQLQQTAVEKAVSKEESAE